MAVSRRQYDPLAVNGIGFPMSVTLFAGLGGASGATTLVASTVDYDRFSVPLTLRGKGKPTDTPVFVIAEAQVHVAAADTGTSVTGSYQFLLKRVDINGNAQDTIATLTCTIANGVVFSQVFSLLDGKGNGYSLKAGEQIRVDTGTIQTGGVAGKNVKIHVTGEVYGIAC